MFMLWWLMNIINSRIMKYIFNQYFISTELSTTKVNLNLVPDVLENNLIIGLMILMLAQAFSYRLRLQQDQN